MYWTVCVIKIFCVKLHNATVSEFISALNKSFVLHSLCLLRLCYIFWECFQNLIIAFVHNYKYKFISEKPPFYYNYNVNKED